MHYSIEREQGFSDYFYCSERINLRHYPHAHSHIEFVFVLEGSLDVNVADYRYRLEAGQLGVIMPYEPHGYAGNARIFLLACPPEYLTEYRQLFTGKVFSPPYATFDTVHQTIIDDIQANHFSDNFKKKALLYYTVSKLMQECVLEDAPPFEFGIYRKALIFISENYAEPITLQSVADHIGVTSVHLSRVLNEDGRPGFSEILNCIRAHAARRMLEKESTTIAEAAMAAGFGSIRNFNRTFKAHFGYNPSDIKKRGQA